MKLKPVVASLVVLGLSGSALAGGPIRGVPACNPNSPAVVQSQAIVDQNSVVSGIDSTNWFNRISVGGIASVVGIYSDRNWPMGGFLRDSGSDLYVNNANLLVNATLTDWAKATVNLYYNGHPTYGNPVVFNHDRTLFDFGFASLHLIEGAHFSGNHSIDKNVSVDEAYVTIANFCKTPFYLVVGQKYLPFGSYTNPYVPVEIMSPAQRMSTFNDPAVIAGIATNFGVYASVFGSKGKIDGPHDHTAQGFVRNFGGMLGYYDDLGGVGISNAHMNINVAYINDMSDGVYNFGDWPFDFGLNVNITNPHPGRVDIDVSIDDQPNHRDAIPGMSGHLDVAYQQWDFAANFVSALKKVVQTGDPNFNTFPKHFITHINSDTNTQLYAGDLNAGFSFPVYGHDSRLGLSFQFTGNMGWAADFRNIMWYSLVGSRALYNLIPDTRWVGDYKISIFKNVDLDLTYAYSRSNSYKNVVDFGIPEANAARDAIWGPYRDGRKTTNTFLGSLIVHF